MLLCGSERWVVTPTMLHALAGFHHQVAHRVTNHLPQHDQHGWYLGISPPCQTGQFFHHEGIHPRTIADYIASCLIFNLCTQAQPPFTLQLPASDNKENTPSASPMQSRLYRWWTQPSSESAHAGELGQSSTCPYTRQYMASQGYHSIGAWSLCQH